MAWTRMIRNTGSRAGRQRSVCACAGLILLVAAALPFAAGGAEEQAPSPEFRVIGYLPDYRGGKIDAIELHLLTDVIYFSLAPTPDGELDLSHVREDDLRRLRRATAEQGVRLAIAVGGWGRSDGFAAMAADDRARRRFLDRLAAFCREHELDGIDFDWEWPDDARQWSDYGRLLREAAERLEPADLRLTAAFAEVPEHLDAPAWDALDRVHLMAYDLPGRHADYEAVVALMDRWLQAEVLGPERLALGVPFYGRHVRTRQALSYADLLAEHEPEPGADLVAGYAFDSQATVGRKTRAALERGLGGIMIWELGQAPPGTLLQAIARQVQRERRPRQPGNKTEAEPPGREEVPKVKP